MAAIQVLAIWRQLRIAAPFLVVFLALVPSAEAQTTSPGRYALNQAESLVSFTIFGKALLPIKREGRFKEFAGEVAYNPEHPDDTRVDLTVNAASIDMNNAGQDTLLRSGDFFDTDHFPTIHFTGAAAGAMPDGTMTVEGDLTIRGITKRISTPVKFRTDGAHPDAMFETTFQIDRSDFGLNGVPKVAGFNVSIAKKVQIHIAIATGANGPSMR